MKPLCIISGGTSGIGFAIAKAMHLDYRFALIFRENEKRAESALAELGAIGADARSFRADLAIAEEAARVCDEIEAWSAAPPAVLLNCAGRSLVSYFVTDPVQTSRQAIESNLFVCLNLSHVVLRKMFAARAGRVINFSSIAVDGFDLSHVAYATAKAAVEAFTEGVAREVYRRGIRVNCVRPGIVSTPMTKTLMDVRADLAAVALPLDAVVGAVRYLLSDAAEAVSGTVLTVDRGAYGKHLDG